MTRGNQKRFVRELTANILREVIEKIEAGKTLPTWDGHELRCVLSCAFEKSAMMTVIKQEPRSIRARDFKQHCFCNNL
jgi:hypothetical protein